MCIPVSSQTDPRHTRRDILLKMCDIMLPSNWGIFHDFWRWFILGESTYAIQIQWMKRSVQTRYCVTQIEPYYIYIYIYIYMATHVTYYNKADCVWVGRRRSRPKGKPRFKPFGNCVLRVAQTWLNGNFPSPREFCGQLKRKQLYTEEMWCLTQLIPSIMLFLYCVILCCFICAPHSETRACACACLCVRVLVRARLCFNCV